MNSAGLTRRFAALLYDSLLIIAMAMVLTGVALMINHGNDVYQNIFFQVFLGLSIAGFYIYFWQKTGQTLGMQAWRLKVQNQNGSLLSLNQCMIRFIMSLISFLCGGIGYLWLLVDKEKRTWHDHCSKSWVIVLPKRKKTK